MIVPTWFNVVSSDGTYTSLASKDYVDKAHDMGLKVWAMVENVSTQESIKNLNTKTLMSSTSTRKKLIEKLMNEADTYGFDGFNLDFESLKAEAGPHYVQFIREMSVACRNKGLVLSVDNYVPSSYTAFYNRKEQGIVADYVIVMGYDEHYAGRRSRLRILHSLCEGGHREYPERGSQGKGHQCSPLLYQGVDCK